MKLGLRLGYWGAGPDPDVVERVAAAEGLGFDSIWTAEAYGSDALTPLAWLGARTSRVRLGTSVIQISARTPAAAAMAGLTLDHLSGGRVVLGVGASGPQVVEGWYGAPYRRPLARTREYVQIMRQVFAREKVEFDGAHYQVPYRGGLALASATGARAGHATFTAPDAAKVAVLAPSAAEATGPASATGLGKPLRPTVHPLRADLPILLAAEGPKNVALAAEIADGWQPLFYAPRHDAFYRDALAEGFARPGARRTIDDFEVVCMVEVVIDDDVEAAADRIRPFLALYVGGMGAKGANFHYDVFARMGFEAECARIQEAYLAGRKDEAAAAVPTRMVEEVALVGPRAKIVEELDVWRSSLLTTMVVGGSPATLERIAEVLG